MALQLRKHGIRRVRPLLGGFYEWKHLAYPMVDISGMADEAPQSGQTLTAEGPA